MTYSIGMFANLEPRTPPPSFAENPAVCSKRSSIYINIPISPPFKEHD